jgi:hypothetical protein
VAVFGLKLGIDEIKLVDILYLTDSVEKNLLQPVE